MRKPLRNPTHTVRGIRKASVGAWRPLFDRQGQMPDMGSLKQVEISANLQDFWPFPHPRSKSMATMTMAYPPKDPLNLEECSAHRVMSVGLIFIIFIQNVLTPPRLKSSFGTRFFIWLLDWCCPIFQTFLGTWAYLSQESLSEVKICR